MANAGSGIQPTSAVPFPALHILADTNVVLDLLLARQPWLAEAQSMWDARDAGRLFVYLSASSLTDIFYICRKQAGLDRARQVVETCLRGFSIVGVDRAILVAALSFPGSDFEDNVQIACAQAAGLDRIVTRNIPDFEHSPIAVADPPAIVSHLGRPSP